MKIRERLDHLGGTPRGRRILRVVQTALTIGIILFLVWKLRAVEFREVLQGLPQNPGFYVLLVALYFLLPTIQILAYRSVWDFRLGAGIKAFIKKRILNKDVLGYSGEVYLFAWAQKQVDLPRRALMESVRDMNIISAAASTLMAVLLLAFFVLEGRINIQDLIGERQAFALVGAGVFTIILLLIIFTRRRWLFSMPWRATRIVFGLHITRVLLRQVLEISMWHLAMPEVPLQTWFTYAALSIIVTRIPISNQDLLFMGLGVSIAGAMTVSEAHIAALFGAVALVHRLINLLFFAILSVRLPQGEDREPVTKVAAEASIEIKS